jgi:guanyl-specific ribonuclease Sa
VTGSVDLSLPSDQELMAAGASNPEVQAAKLTRTGSPDRIREVGKELMVAGVGMDRVYQQSGQAQQALAGAFTNNGAPVYNEAAHQQSLPTGFRDAGTQMHDDGQRLGAVADELGAAIADVSRSMDGLRADLGARRSGFLAEVDAARAAGGLIPVEAVPALQARRDAVSAGMREAVNACGREITGRIDRYNGVLNDCLRLLGGAGGAVPGPDSGVAIGGPGTQFDRLFGGRLEGSTPAPPPLPTPGFTPAPGGPFVLIHPIPEPLPGLPGFTPAPPPLGPLITSPAPGLGTHREAASPDARGKPAPGTPAPGTPPTPSPAPVPAGPPTPVPASAQDTLGEVDKKGSPPPGYQGGGAFQNDGRGGGEVLPKTAPSGGPIGYKEWDIKPFQPGVNRGPERIVTGSDGSAYYTNDHYKTFVKIRGGK